MLDLYVLEFDEEKDYDFDLKKLNQEVIDYVLRMDENRRDLSIFSYLNLIDLLKNKYHLDKVELSFEGKPHLIDKKLYFNIAHTEGRVALAISDQEVGVDIERKTRRIRPDLYKKVLSEEERIIYERRKDTSLYFLTCWVKKEAYLKYLGTGIDRHLNSISSENLVNAKIIEDEDYLISIYSKLEDLTLLHKSV